MKSKEIFKKKFEDGEFNELLKNVRSPEDVVKIANDLGYELTIDDVLNSELGDDALSLVAGGKKDTYVYNVINDSFKDNTTDKTTINGNNNKQLKT